MNIEKTISGADAITLDQAKAFMRIDGTYDDAFITLLIQQARSVLEDYLDRSLVSSTIKLYIWFLNISIQYVVYT